MHRRGEQKIKCIILNDALNISRGGVIRRQDMPSQQLFFTNPRSPADKAASKEWEGDISTRSSLLKIRVARSRGPHNAILADWKCQNNANHFLLHFY